MLAAGDVIRASELYLPALILVLLGAFAEAMPIGLLLTLCLGLMIFAGPVMRYLEDTARSLDDPAVYVAPALFAGRTAS